MELISFPNGFRVVLDHIPHVETITMGVWCGVGSRHESPEVGGISHIIEHCMFKGTANRNLEQIINESADIGGMMNAGTGLETTSYYLGCLSEYRDQALDLLADIVMNPIFPESELEKERGVIIQELKMYEDHPDSVAYEAAIKAALPGQALGRPIIGTSETIMSVTRDDLVKYYHSTYCPDKMVLSISGNLGNQTDIIKVVEQTFATMNGRSSSTTEPFVFSNSEVRIEKDVNQVNLMMLFPSVGIYDEDKYTVALLGSILGSGMSSRLFREIREKRGLCYGIYSGLDTKEDGGLFMIGSGTDEGNANELITATSQEIVTTTRTTVTDDEVRRALITIKSNTVKGLEATGSRASRSANSVLRFGKLRDIKEEIAKYEAVSIADINRVARETFSNKPTIGLCGRLDGVVSYDDVLKSLEMV